ncbi:3-oxoacyl-ACP reductase FabG [Streptomyces chartreusis]|uniref:3-oxoacyl-ACP reductase FabG n=1 Tax=Streptomyces chartreusis TaxID=1969 RepID=A0A7H8TK60_STRCX|nr:3-oxoacyl-ACP reductase FabG [Streptomyces chartreusis]QKZ23909.1 3-oxoacyl-ACP reductase FabG [Streptomyces chartreusis]
MNRSVLITGGSRGIGRAIAESFLAQGDKVATISRTGDGPEGALLLKGDVIDAEQVDAAFKEAEDSHGPVEVLVSNAGITRDNLLTLMSPDDFRDVIDTNLTAPALLAKRALRGMMKARKGRIVLIGSAVALAGEAGQANYAAAKAGLIGLARSVAREYGRRGITANVVSPGLTATDMASELNEAQVEKLLAKTPVGRMATPQEIADAVLFLASPAAAYITGVVLPVDGGASMH